MFENSEWDEFAKTGKIDAYLRYKGISSPQEAKSKSADRNRRSDSKSSEHRGQ